jgi:Ca2+-binding EF-hand superfamily protein
MQRLERVFDHFDRDRDGLIVRSDFPAIVDDHFGLAQDDPRARGAKSFYEMYWQVVAGDEEGLIKPEFFIAHSERSFDAVQEEAACTGVDSIFQYIADDGGDEISKEEFVRFLGRIWRVSDGDAENAFAELDTDGDGRVSRQEFTEAAQEYLFSRRFNALGAVLFGDI